MAKEKSKVDDILKRYEKKYEMERASTIKILPKVRTKWFSLDYILDGGISQGIGGHLIEFQGKSSSGKTTACLKLIARYQQLGKVCALITVEGYDATWGEINGVNNRELLINRPSEQEKAGMLILDLMQDDVDLIIVDSLAMLCPQAEIDKELGEKTRGEQAQVNTVLSRKINRIKKLSNTTVIFINQVRDNQSPYGDPIRIPGGHCFDLKTRIVTNKGIKGIDEIKKGDMIPTINLDSQCIEYKPITEIHKYNHKGKMYEFSNKYENEEFLFTPKHQCLVKKYTNGSMVDNKYKLVNAEDKRREFGMPICFPSGNPEYDIKDSELKLLGWLLTDSSIRLRNEKTYEVVLYQSTKNHWKRIESILIENNIDHKKTKRVRYDERYGHSNSSYEFYIRKAKETINKYNIDLSKIIPTWCRDLSDRQAKILFHEMMLADGTLINNIYSSICKHSELWIQTLYLFLITHNIPASKYQKDKNKNCYTLRLRQPNYIGLKSRPIDYTGIVWDISVQDNPLHFIERNGCIIATHNSLAHLYDTRIRFTQGKPIEEKGERIGFKMDMWCKKNKLGKPYRRAVIDFYLSGQIDNEETLLMQACKYGIIDQSGKWFTYNEIKYDGKKALKEVLTQKDWDKIEDEIWKVMK